MGGHSGSSAAPAPTPIKDTSQITDAGRAAQAAYNESVKTGVAMEDGTYIDADGKPAKSSSSTTSTGVKPAASTQAARTAGAKSSSMQTSAVVTG